MTYWTLIGPGFSLSAERMAKLATAIFCAIYTERVIHFRCDQLDENRYVHHRLRS
jgi:hypothetical protein